MGFCTFKDLETVKLTIISNHLNHGFCTFKDLETVKLPNEYIGTGWGFCTFKDLETVKQSISRNHLYVCFCTFKDLETVKLNIGCYETAIEFLYLQRFRKSKKIIPDSKKSRIIFISPSNILLPPQTK